MVRKSSKVLIDYPSAIAHRVVVERPPRPNSAVNLHCKFKKTVHWDDEVQFDPDTGQPLSIALTRSKKLMGSLYDLRRSAEHVTSSKGLTVISPGQMTDEDGGESPTFHMTLTRTMSSHYAQEDLLEEQAQEDLLHGTLKDLEDNITQLSALEKEISSCMDPVQDRGGGRHATQIIYGRTLHVIRRKLQLMHEATDRAEAMEESHSRRDELLAGVASGRDEGPPALANVKKFIFSLTHHPGDPVDANKSDFHQFVTSFKLPSKHGCLERLRDLSKKTYTWWANACLRTAESGASIDDISRVMDVAVGAGSPEDHPDLIRGLVVGAQLVKKRFQAIDVTKVRVEDLPLGQPTETADKIEVAIKNAKSGGGGQQELNEAVRIVADLREMEIVWRRLAGRAKRKQGRRGSSSGDGSK
jgi:hypothetical protein